MTKAVTEKELQEKSVAPRVTKEQIDALMDQVTYVVVRQPGDTTSTFVHAYLDGSFFLASGFSACMNKDNFNAEIGERLARSNAEKNAQNKLWELEGYRLFQKGKRWCEAEKTYELTNGQDLVYKTLVLAIDGDEDDALSLAQERFELNGQEKSHLDNDWTFGNTEVKFLED
ncbi:hypothetical protein I2F25_00380 [Acinetobacter pollinis]|uniref:Phage protein n=1 Tax=Acinetobacter pollinis TaxID=2605270 RepID=A0ABU6DR05_9GAMM|nr:hypothetical protein [Acinetobacter pollinis]